MRLSFFFFLDFLIFCDSLFFFSFFDFCSFFFFLIFCCLFFSFLIFFADDGQFYTAKPPRSGKNTCTKTPANALTFVRAGALVPSPPCLGEGATRVGPGQYPQCTRADFGQEAVACSLHKDHREPQMSQEVSPTHSTRLTSHAFF